MKILQVNKFLYPKGGTETHLFALISLLEKNGHQIEIFSQENEKNYKHGDSKYFLSNIELSKFNFDALKKIGRIFWSFKAAKKMKALIDDKQPDIAHIHNIYHQISPSILPVLKKANIPVVMTVHDFKLIKSDYTLKATDDKSRHKNSIIADILLKLEFTFHKTLRVYKKNVDRFIVPSDFVKNQLIKHGFSKKKIIVLRHFVDSDNEINNEEAEDYIVAFCRLSRDKGIDTLIKAYAKLVEPKMKLKIIGNGPEKENLIQLTDDLNIEQSVEFLGWKNKEELKGLISKSQFVVFPSRVHETFGLTALESFKYSKAVVAAKVGALPEIITENESGLLFEPDNVSQLTSNLRELMIDPKKAKTMGEAGFKTLPKFSSDKYYAELSNIYKSLLR